MVMVTRSAYKKASESFNCSDVSQNNIIPPWCSSGRLIEKRKRQKVPKPEWESRSPYPLRENLWEYLKDEKDIRHFACTKGKPAKNCDSKQLQHKQERCGNKFLRLLISFLFAAALYTMSSWKFDSISSRELIAKVVPKPSFINSPVMDYAETVGEECCHRMAHLAAELSRAQQALRKTWRLRRTLLLMSRTIPEFDEGESATQRGHVMGTRAFKGGNTSEWGGRIALWGVIPLWRASPPPDTILAKRPPTPSDCWPFSGSYGEVIIELAHKARVDYISVEHVRPDTARSAPRNFVVVSILENNTRLETAHGTYTYKKPAKQYFPLNDRSQPVKSVAFQVLSNQGNRKYTCIYRVHLYGSEVDGLTIVL